MRNLREESKTFKIEILIELNLFENEEIARMFECSVERINRIEEGIKNAERAKHERKN